MKSNDHSLTLSPEKLERLQDFLDDPEAEAGEHPSDDQLNALAGGGLDTDAKAELDSHLKACQRCSQAMAWLLAFRGAMAAEAQRRNELSETSRHPIRIICPEHLYWIDTVVNQDSAVPVRICPSPREAGMRNKAGPPVRKEDFLEREQETEELWHRAERGHVLMSAPRRVGKTSLLFHLADSPRAGWNCLYLSTEALDSESQFVARLLETASAARSDHAWKERFEVASKQILKSLGPAKAGPVDINIGQALETEWRDIGAIALKAMQGLPGNTLILVDEFPVFVRNLLGSGDDPEGRQRAKRFLDWFRATRNAQSNGPGRVHFILTGSLGLDRVVRAVGLTGTINDLDIFSLGPLSIAQARKLLRCLSEGEDLPLPEAVQARILEHIDWPIPYYLQLLFREVLSRVRFRGQLLDVRLVDESYRSLLGPAMVKHFDYWKERLDDPLFSSPVRDLRRGLLDEACKDRRGLSRSSIVQIWQKVAPDEDADDVLLGLSHEGYLTPKGSRWHYTSRLLRDWWRKWQVKERAS